MGCHSITSYATEYRAALPNKLNKTAVSVKKDSLNSRIYTSDQDIKGDIISIVMEISGLEFKETLKQIHELLGFKFSFTSLAQKKKVDVLDVFKKAIGCNHYDKQELKPINESVLENSNFIKLPHINLIREGIIPRVQEEFGVMYDIKTQRILFPHRHWSTGELLGIFGRTTIEEWDILGIPKYWGVIPYHKSLNLYGLYENYKAIQDYGMVVVFEGEKSPQKAKSLGIPYGVALGGHELSAEQVKILISLNVKIIFALDEGIDEQVSIDMCKQFKGIRPAYYLYGHDKLGKKDSPIDKGINVFKYIMENCQRKVV